MKDSLMVVLAHATVSITGIAQIRRDGMVPAIGIGGNGLLRFPLHSVGFERVHPDGTPAVSKHVADFTVVNWTNDHLNPNLPALAITPFDFEMVDNDVIPDPIRDFTSMMANLYNEIVAQFGNEVPQRYHHFGCPIYYQALNSKLDLNPRARNELMARRATGANPTLRPIPASLPGLYLKQVLPPVLTGFTHGYPVFLYQCLSTMVESLNAQYELNVTPCPAETSRKPLEDGVPHCLVYGYLECDGNPPSQSGDAAKDINIPPETRARGRQRYREIVRKATGDRSRSRSQSPVALGPARDFLEDLRPVDPVKQPEEGRRDGIQINHLDADPFNYSIKPDKLSCYLEPHKPDITILETSSADCELKVVVEVTSISRFKPTICENVDKLLREATYKCLWSALAALQLGQRRIYGLVVICEGIKALRVQLENNQWIVSETELIHFNDEKNMKAMLYHVLSQATQNLSQ